MVAKGALYLRKTVFRGYNAQYEGSGLVAFYCIHQSEGLLLHGEFLKLEVDWSGLFAKS